MSKSESICKTSFLEGVHLSEESLRAHEFGTYDLGNILPTIFLFRISKVVSEIAQETADSRFAMVTCPRQIIERSKIILMLSICHRAYWL